MQANVSADTLTLPTHQSQPIHWMTYNSLEELAQHGLVIDNKSVTSNQHIM